MQDDEPERQADEQEPQHVGRLRVLRAEHQPERRARDDAADREQRQEDHQQALAGDGGELGRALRFAGHAHGEGVHEVRGAEVDDRDGLPRHEELGARGVAEPLGGEHGDLVVEQRRAELRHRRGAEEGDRGAPGRAACRRWSGG